MKLFGGRGAVVAALALGALTSYMAWRYVDQANSSGQKVEMAPVVVANASIPARTIITPDLVRVQQIPVQAIHPLATHSVEEVIGKVVRTEMSADEPVLTNKLFLQRGESGLAFMVPEGMRAVSVGFTEIIGSGGMVTPGDHVDIIGVFEAKGLTTTQPTGQNGQNERNQAQQPSLGPNGSDPNQQTSLATMVLQDVQLLAVAQRLEGEETKKDQGLAIPGANPQQSPQAQMAQRSEPAPQPQAKTATLAVGPEDALKLVLAE
jgi:pilus assembly protein CpaB